MRGYSAIKSLSKSVVSARVRQFSLIAGESYIIKLIIKLYDVRKLRNNV